MKYKITNWIAVLIFTMSAGGAVFAVATPQIVAAAPAPAKCVDTLLTFPAWYRGLQDPANECQIKKPASSKDGLSAFIWTIVLNVIEFALQLVAYISVAFIIVGGFKYMTSAGSADGMSKAKTTIMNAVIGLVLSFFSVAIIRVVAGAIQ